MNRIIALWSHPRALSTAFLRMVMERGDFYTLHEPLSNLQAQNVWKMVDEKGEPLATVTSYAELVALTLRLAQDKKVFIKETTEYRYQPLLDDTQFLSKVVHTFIVREPRKAIASHYAVNPKVKLEEIGYEYQFELFRKAQEQSGRTPVVIDADDLVNRPAELVKAYCEAVQIPFIESALTWKSGSRKEWERTNTWHLDVNDSTQISKREKTYAVTVDNNDELRRYYDHHLPFYERMHRHRLLA